MKVLVATSSFKGTLSNEEACRAVCEGLQEAGVSGRPFPVGDGGRGTRLAIQQARGGVLEAIEACGPYGEPAIASVCCAPDAERPREIYVESADTCGSLRSGGERDAMAATSRGLGLALAAVFARWGQYRPALRIGLGDSLVSDVGLGMLCGLGYRFFDRSGQPIAPNAYGLESLGRWQPPEGSPWRDWPITALCDVENPLCGPHGSARIFAPQKGATGDQVSRIEAAMESFGEKISAGGLADPRAMPMSGAAGGLAAGLAAFLGARLVLGIDFVLEATGFDSALAAHDLLITGEGRTDSQSLGGKAPWICCQRAGKSGKPSVLVSGQVTAEAAAAFRCLPGVIGVAACGREPDAATALRSAVRRLFSDPSFRSRG
jgi:glycerate kinase